MGIFRKRRQDVATVNYNEMVEKLMENWSDTDDCVWLGNRVYKSSGPQMPKAQMPKPVPVDPIETAPDDVLVFELLKRGYAVAKMPAEELAKAAE